MLGIYCRTSSTSGTDNSTIIQQRTAGIKFAEENNFEYELYEDEGFSGFKISDDDQNTFNNRPRFTNLINDIKSKKIDKVWVWENSRLSRNNYASAFIFNIFERFEITLYENNQQFNLNDPQTKAMRGFLNVISEYERELIVSRMTRGLYKRINEGKRSHFKLYGYGKSGKDDQGHRIWVPVESELNNYKYAIKRYMEGATLLKISYELYNMNKVEKKVLLNYSSRLGKILRKYQYTGYQLTLEGFDIYQKFIRNEIENLSLLLDRKYWVKSVPFPEELISIEDWITVVEKLQIPIHRINKSRKERTLRASKDIATGLIECSDCGARYYYHEQKNRNNKLKELRIYLSYSHLSTINESVCKQKPKSYSLESINEIFKLFYFYAKLVFDDKNEQTKYSQRNIQQTQIKLKEQITKTEKEISVIEKRISRFQNKLDNSTLEDDLLEILLRNIKSSEYKLNDLSIELSKLKIDYELENEKFNQTLLEMTYYDVKEQINNWFFNMNIEEQRNELIRTINKCLGTVSKGVF
jgi:DNA invertase Pin-like site-specific DNA recombinase